MTNSVNDNIKQMNLLQIILYHLLPGIPVFLFAGLFFYGFSMNMTHGFLFTIAFGLIPVQLLIIYITAKKQNVKFKDIISFTEKISLFKLFLWVLPCVVIGWLTFRYFSGIEISLWSDTFTNGFEVEDYIQEASGNDIPLLIIMLTFLFNGFLAPIVEEYYFRGFLLPRMNKLGKSAPAVNSILFSLYHLFSPMEILTRILALLPLSYVVWYKKNIYIGIVVHCSLNLFGMTMMFFL